MNTLYIYIIEDKLAISPLPSLSDIDELSRVFDGVVVLVEPHEVLGYIDYYLDKWRHHGVEVFYAPTPDFHPVDLLTLQRINMWIDERIRGGGRILIHCRGGVGRSGMVAAAYLLYRGWDLHEAIRYVAEKRPGAPGNSGQIRVLEDYHRILGVLGVGEMARLIEDVSETYDTVHVKHVSRSLQYMVELDEYLEVRTSKEYYIALFYHCLKNPERRRSLAERYGYRVVEILEKYLGGKYDEPSVLLMAISHTLDYTMDGRIIYIDHEYIGGTHYIVHLYILDPSRIIYKVKPLYRRLSEILGVEMSIGIQPYYESV